MDKARFEMSETVLQVAFMVKSQRQGHRSQPAHKRNHIPNGETTIIPLTLRGPSPLRSTPIHTLPCPCRDRSSVIQSEGGSGYRKRPIQPLVLQIKKQKFIMHRCTTRHCDAAHAATTKSRLLRRKSHQQSTNAPHPSPIVHNRSLLILQPFMTVSRSSTHSSPANRRASHRRDAFEGYEDDMSVQRTT